MKKEKSKFNFNLKLDFGTFLLITGAMANVTLWIGAFVSTEAQGPVSAWIREFAIPLLGGISGLGMGITVSFGLVYVFVHLSKMHPTLERKVRGKDEIKTSINFRFWFAVASIVTLLIISPALLAPYVLMLISDGQTLYSVLGIQGGWLWSVGRVIAADLALGAIALVHGAHLGAGAVVAGATGSATSATQSDGSATRTPKKTARSAAEMRMCEHGCSISYRWPQGKGAHMKKYHPELCVVKGTPAGTVLPIRQNVEERTVKNG